MIYRTQSQKMPLNTYIDEIISGVRSRQFHLADRLASYPRDSFISFGMHIADIFNEMDSYCSKQINDLQSALRISEYKAAHYKELVERKEGKIVEGIHNDTSNNQMEELNEQILQLNIKLETSHLENMEQQNQIDTLVFENDCLQNQVAELNRMVASQHQQLMGLLGSDFDRP